jgi:hypothetical protein
MGVYIKGMRMPKDCRECRFQDYVFTTGVTWCGANCVVLARNFEAIKFDGRPDWCPLVDLGKHGDLIDADELAETAEFYETIMDIRHHAKIVIKAED